MRIDDQLLTTLQTANLRGAVAAGVARPLSDQALTVHASGVAPGRIVMDTVTGAAVTVIGSTTVYLPLSAIPR